MYRKYKGVTQRMIIVVMQTVNKKIIQIAGSDVYFFINTRWFYK